MYKFSNSSKKKLESVRSDLQIVLNEAIKVIDFTVVYGLRTTIEQQMLYAQGRTTPGKIVTYLDGVTKRSKHQDALAVDLAPYPIDWDNHKRFILLAGYIQGIANQLNVNLRWGGDWNRNNIMEDQRWNDLPHYELL